MAQQPLAKYAAIAIDIDETPMTKEDWYKLNPELKNTDNFTWYYENFTPLAPFKYIIKGTEGSNQITFSPKINNEEVQNIEIKEETVNIPSLKDDVISVDFTIDQENTDFSASVPVATIICSFSLLSPGQSTVTLNGQNSTNIEFNVIINEDTIEPKYMTYSEVMQILGYAFRLMTNTDNTNTGWGNEGVEGTAKVETATEEDNNVAWNYYVRPFLNIFTDQISGLGAAIDWATWPDVEALHNELIAPLFKK